MVPGPSARGRCASKIARNDEDKLARIMRAAYDMAEDMKARQKQRKL
jgi:hypothetical protein